jgi:hypothetical protein
MVTKRGQVYVCILDDRRVKRLSGLGYKLECIVCHIPFNRGETIVHKGKRLYHPQCWQIVWHDIPDDILDEDDIYFIESGEYSSTISTSIPTTILRE